MITDSETKSMIAELERIIREEEAKPESERDADLIDDCIREIAELKGVKAEFSAEEIAEITGNLIKVAKKEQRRKRFVRLTAGIAAAVVLVTGITACTINPALINWFVKIVRMPFGSTLDHESITYCLQGTSTKYTSIEELIRENELDVYYPTAYPSNTKLIKLTFFYENEVRILSFKFSSADFHYAIQFQYFVPTEEEETVAEIEANGLHFIVCQKGDRYLSYAQDTGKTYIIQANNIDDIILFVGGLRKELKN